MNGHSNILLIPTCLVPFEEVVTTLRAVIIQLLSASATLRPMPTTTTVLGAYFIKSSSYDPKWLIKIAQNTDFERSSQVCIF